MKPAFETTTCPACEGLRYVMSSAASGDGEELNVERCRTCRGTGEVRATARTQTPEAASHGLFRKLVGRLSRKAA